MNQPTHIKSPRARLVYHVQELERLESLKADAAKDFADGLADAKSDGFDGVTIRAVLKLRKMTPEQRSERRALEAIYMAALGMLEGEGLPDEARRRLDGAPDASQPRLPDPPPDVPRAPDDTTAEAKPPQPEQAPLIVKDPAEAKQEGADASAAGKRIYDNPYLAGDPCRAAWDEGWCSQQKSHGMETPAAYQRRTEKPPKDGKGPGDRDAGAGDSERGAA